MKQDNPTDAQRNLDSPINTKDGNSANQKSLTNDERASADPNAEKTKPTFKENETSEDAEESGRFDGEVGI
ncbi:MAG: hypothetical protein EOO48_10890 [Flavobacterium sp.]|nr:MAG: hypothetical protein EOO48_10890 [Flavobacterium sp.]